MQKRRRTKHMLATRESKFFSSISSNKNNIRICSLPIAHWRITSPRLMCPICSVPIAHWRMTSPRLMCETLYRNLFGREQGLLRHGAWHTHTSTRSYQVYFAHLHCVTATAAFPESFLYNIARTATTVAMSKTCRKEDERTICCQRGSPSFSPQ